MSIYGISGGSVVRLAPRVKHNGVIKTPATGWAKQGGVLKKIWGAVPSTDDVKCSLYMGPCTVGNSPGIIANGWIIYLYRPKTLSVPVTYTLTELPPYNLITFYDALEGGSPAPLTRNYNTSLTLAAGADYSAHLYQDITGGMGSVPTAIDVNSANVILYGYNQVPGWGVEWLSSNYTLHALRGLSIEASYNGEVLWSDTTSLQYELQEGEYPSWIHWLWESEISQ